LLYFTSNSDRLRAEKFGVRITTAARNFTLLRNVQTGCGTRPSPVLNEYRDSLPAVIRPGREFHHSLPPSAEVKNEWSYTLTRQSPIPVAVRSKA
jgi:hypothetical protein